MSDGANSEKEGDGTFAAVRRGGRVVERGGLENRCAFTGTGGSNPSLSAERPRVSGALFFLRSPLNRKTVEQ